MSRLTHLTTPAGSASTRKMGKSLHIVHDLQPLNAITIKDPISIIGIFQKKEPQKYPAFMEILSFVARH